MLGEKRCGAPGKTWLHYGKLVHGICSRKTGPYQANENSPRREGKAGKERGNGTRGQFLRGAEGVLNGRQQVEGRFVGVLGRGVRFREGKVEKVDFEGRMVRGADNECYL